MSVRDNGGSAFPSKFSLGTDGYGNEVFGVEQGMSLRDWFAGQALGAASSHAFANAEDGTVMGHLPEEWAARIAYALADAMLAERQKGGA